MNWLVKLLFVALSEILIALVEFLGDIINNVFDFMYEINVDLNFEIISNYTLAMGLTLVGLFTVKQGIDVFVLHTDGDPDADALEMVTRLTVTVATIMCGQWVIGYLITLAATLADEVVATVEYKDRTAGEIFTDAFMKFLSMGTIIAVIQAVFLAIILIAFLIFIYQAAKRGVELILFQAMLPLIAIDLLTTNKEKWNAFKTEALICIFGYILQLFCFNKFMSMLAHVMSVDGMADPKSLFGAGAWLIVVLSGPKWIQKFMYNSGAGDAAKGGARSAGMMLPQLLKR